MVKSLLLAASMTLGVVSTASAQYSSSNPPLRLPGDLSNPPGIEKVVARARLLDRMTYRVGYGLAPGEFFRLSQECLRYGTPDDFTRLLTDGMPLVRVLGLICLAQSVEVQELTRAAASLREDQAIVTYTDGCMLDQTTTVAAIARGLVERRFFFATEVVGRR